MANKQRPKRCGNPHCNDGRVEQADYTTGEMTEVDCAICNGTGERKDKQMSSDNPNEQDYTEQQAGQEQERPEGVGEESDFKKAIRLAREHSAPCLGGDQKITAPERAVERAIEWLNKFASEYEARTFGPDDEILLSRHTTHFLAVQCRVVLTAHEAALQEVREDVAILAATILSLTRERDEAREECKRLRGELFDYKQYHPSKEAEAFTPQMRRRVIGLIESFKDESHGNEDDPGYWVDLWILAEAMLGAFDKAERRAEQAVGHLKDAEQWVRKLVCRRCTTHMVDDEGDPYNHSTPPRERSRAMSEKVERIGYWMATLKNYDDAVVKVVEIEARSDLQVIEIKRLKTALTKERAAREKAGREARFCGRRMAEERFAREKADRRIAALEGVLEKADDLESACKILNICLIERTAYRRAREGAK